MSVVWKQLFAILMVVTSFEVIGWATGLGEYHFWSYAAGMVTGWVFWGVKWSRESR